ncbi:MAG: hypothetical protein ACJA0Q_000720, partial [Saprospiraceae bacterium]
MKNLQYVFVLLISLTLLSSHDRQKGIRHDLNKALTWDDFKGRVERGSKYAANTSS